MRILLVEPDHTTRLSMEMMMTNGGLNVYTSELASEAADLAMLYDYDLIVMEHRLPDGDGLNKILRHIRLARVNTPVMIVSSADDTESKIRSFGLGADDYLTKPFHREELLARIQTIIRRARGHSQSVVETGNVSVNLNDKTVQVNGNTVHLTSKEYQMLELMSLRKGATLTKEMFLSHLYGGMDEPELRIIDVFVSKLRKKLKDAGAPEAISTIWGRGYTMRDPEQDTASEFSDA
jgi:two-component system cell cycle response regulator CtrA